MGALNYIAYAITAALFLSLAVVLYTDYSRAMEEQRFTDRAYRLADSISSLASQDPGTEWYFQIKVPSTCELSFHDNSVNVVVGGKEDRLLVSIPVSGPVLRGSTANLKLSRTENGVEVSA